MQPCGPLAMRQLGLVTTRQLRDLGWTTDAVAHAARRGRLVAVRRGVWRTAGAPVSREQIWLAAVLAVPGSVLSHGTAWAGWGLRYPPERDAVDLLVVRGRAPAAAGVRCHRTIALPPSHLARIGVLPVTSVERTIVDACGLVSPAQLERTVMDAVRRRLTTLPQLARCLDEVPVSGRRASAPLRDLLADRIPAWQPGDSDPEADVVEFLVKNRFPKPAQNVKVLVDGEQYEVDIAWVDIRCGFERDSVQFHGDVFAFHRDRKKWRALRRAGWRVDPITSETTPEEILAIASEFFATAPDRFGGFGGA
jgi:hypothetical protein